MPIPKRLVFVLNVLCVGVGLVYGQNLNPAAVDDIVASIFTNGTTTISPIQNVNDRGEVAAIDDLIDKIFVNHTTPDPPTIPVRGDGGEQPNTNEEEPIQEEGEECPDGECIEYYLCNTNKTLNIYGDGILDNRFGERVCHFLQTCCKSNQVLEEPIEPKFDSREGCGHRREKGIGFNIKSGKEGEAQFGEFPWMVAILKEIQLSGKIIPGYKCAGSLIHPQVVMTAAHCIYDVMPSDIILRAGEWDTQIQTEPLKSQDIVAKEVIIHEDFYKPASLNDIALIIGKEPFKLDGHIQTACLPPPKHVFDSHNCYASGWGKDQFGKTGKFSVILKKVGLPIVSRPKCQNLLRKTRLSKHFILHDSFICAGGIVGKDTCKGDGGAPLVCPIPGAMERYYQAGIVSWGIGCNTETPGVYVNVPLFRNWIDQKMKLSGFDTKHYTP